MRLPKHATQNRLLTVRAAASDPDRHARLSVILQARRGQSAWQTIAIGPARLKATFQPTTLGTGKKLRVRLIISDGCNTTNVNAPPISLTDR